MKNGLGHWTQHGPSVPGNNIVSCLEMDTAITFLLYLNIFRTLFRNKFSRTKNWAPLEPKYQNNLTSPLYIDYGTNLFPTIL